VGSADDALTIAAKLEAAGIRATTDATALNPPAVLIPPPRRDWDTGCGYTATWTLHAIAPAITGGDRVTWAQLDQLVDAIASVYPVTSALPGAYVLEGKAMPSYAVTFTAPGGD
jgi:hypothetical protein